MKVFWILLGKSSKRRWVVKCRTNLCSSEQIVVWIWGDGWQISLHQIKLISSATYFCSNFCFARQYFVYLRGFFLVYEDLLVSFGNSCRSWTRLSLDYWQYFYSRHFSHVCPLKVIYFEKSRKYVAYFLFMKLIWLQQNHQTTYHHATLLQFIQEKGKGGKNTFVSTQSWVFP